MSELDEQRRIIDQSDAEIRRAFEKRFSASKKIGAYKKEHGLKTCDPKREEEVVEKNAGMVQDPLLRKYYVRLLRQMMRLSREYQEEANRE